MINKRIIIDNVNVSECKYIELTPTTPKCSINDWIHCDGHNCYYKQLKRKEYEYEDLRQYHNKCCKENAEKLEQWLEKFNQVSRDFYNGKYCNKENCRLLQDKEQECEKWKKYGSFYLDKFIQLKQTLTEIKEITEQGVKIHDDIIVSKQILQKISEVQNAV